jgi:Site-specific recombinases, DNA invertase Pin homologs
MSRVARNRKDVNNLEKGQYWNTALYIRLSREDGDKEESDSVGNQRDMLNAYMEGNKQFKLYDTYIDDGYTGTNFNRPDFKRMVEDMKQGRINCIIVKDLSRFGRDYIGVGDYQENVFPRYGVRFIAINDRIDTSLNQEESNSIIVPFKNIINEQYARDISRKVRSALDIKRRRGEFIGAFACYGYQKDPMNKNHLIIDEDASEIVKKIFIWFISGQPKLAIAQKLNTLEIPCPSEYKKQKGQKYVNPNKLDRTFYWTHTTVHRILNNEMYLGNMVQHTQTIQNFKQKKNTQVQKDDWIIVPGTHEAIIDQKTWEIAQRLLQADIKKSQYTGEVHLFAGLIKCADCGRSMKKRVNSGNIYYICGTYMMYGKKYCSSHSIRYDELKGMVFAELKAQIDKYVDFNRVSTEIQRQNSRNSGIKVIENKLIELQKKLDNIMVLKRGLYEDLKRGLLTEEEYTHFKKDYDNQNVKIEGTISEFNDKIRKQSSDDTIRRSSDMILKYKDATEPTRELLVSLVKSISISEDKSIVIDFDFYPL